LRARSAVFVPASCSFNTSNNLLFCESCPLHLPVLLQAGLQLHLGEYSLAGHVEHVVSDRNTVGFDFRVHGQPSTSRHKWHPQLAIEGKSPVAILLLRDCRLAPATGTRWSKSPDGLIWAVFPASIDTDQAAFCQRSLVATRPRNVS
jgi:hypothetical protein